MWAKITIIIVIVLSFIIYKEITDNSITPLQQSQELNKFIYYDNISYNSPYSNSKTINRIIDIITEYSILYNIPFEVAISLAYHESHLDTMAHGTNNDIGLFQITRWPVNEYNKYYNTNIKHSDVYNIELNTKIALFFLREKLNESNNNLHIALGRYNAGSKYQIYGDLYYSRFLMNKTILLGDKNGQIYNRNKNK